MNSYIQQNIMIKRSLIIVIIVISMLLLFACGQNNPAPVQEAAATTVKNETTTTTAKDTNVKSEDSTKEETVDNASDEKDVKDDAQTTTEEKKEVNIVVDEAVLESAQSAVTEGLTYSESPWFEGKDYPPVNERLPKNPATWNWLPKKDMTFQIGKYSEGPLRTVRMNPTWDAIAWTAATEPLIVTPGRLAEEFIPNVLESYEISDDLKTFTFTLREGMKWSDGYPVTTDDAYFAFHNFNLDPRLYPVTSAWFRAGGKNDGEVCKMEVVDKYTWRFIFTEPFGGLILHIANGTYTEYLQPAHYLKDFHIEFAKEEVLKKQVEDAGYLWPEEWPTFFQFHKTDGWDTGRTSQMYGATPTLAPWIHSVDGDLRIYHRNPYFWQVDPEGRQLPYIDYIYSYYATDIAAAQVMLLGGQIDHSYEWMQLNQVPLFAENAEKNGYKVVTTSMLHRTDADIQINQTYDDEAWRSMAQDVRFRKALSLAVNRSELIETVYYGFARESDFHDKPTYDLAQANALLDEMGMEYGPDGFRKAPNGTPIVIDFVYSDQFAQYVPTAQIVHDQLRELGLNINLRMVDGSLLDNMASTNQLQLAVSWNFGTHGGGFEHWRNDWWGNLWFKYWNTNGAEGVKPPEHVQKFYETIFSIRRIHPREIPAARESLRKQMAEHCFEIIPVDGISQVLLVNKDLRNVPERGLFIPGCEACAGWWFDR